MTRKSKAVPFSYNPNRDTDIETWLKRQSSVSASIRSAIRLVIQDYGYADLMQDFLPGKRIVKENKTNSVASKAEFSPNETDASVYRDIQKQNQKMNKARGEVLDDRDLSGSSTDNSNQMPQIDLGLLDHSN